MWSPWFSTNNTARLQTLFKRLIGCCLSWEAISEVSVTAEEVRKQGKEETIVTVSNRLLQLNWDSCGFQAPLSITATSINGLNLNDKTISHEQPISLSTGWGSLCVTHGWRDFTAAIWNLVFASSWWLHLSIMTECVITKCLPLNPCYNWQHSAVTRDGETKWKTD